MIYIYEQHDRKFKTLILKQQDSDLANTIDWFM